MADNSKLLKAVFNHLYPDMTEVMPFYLDGTLPDGSPVYMAFEWIGEEDYLGEHEGKRGVRTRGANYTSTDFAFRFKEKDDKVHIVLGEWKYTEEYGYKDYLKPMNIKDRKPEVRYRTYKSAFTKPGGIFSGWNDEFYRGLFFEPFYQLMRLQLLAQKMEDNKKMGANIVSVLHISPEANTVLRNRVTSPYLVENFKGDGIYEIWKEILHKNRFKDTSAEKLLDIIIRQDKYADKNWLYHLKLRYSFC